ncbi:MAG: amidase [Acidobacteria bacterium]|nr:amidase [Acidobacteriota bacterium]
MTRRELLALLAAGAANAAVSDLDEVSLADLRSGALTAVQATEFYLERIAAIDEQVNSIIEINPDALAIAAQLDQGGRRGLLHGIPILIKDNIDTGDRMQTTAGSLALSGSIAPRDSGVAQRLRASGAVILGKTNLSEWANFRSTESTSGWSARGGLTHNPYALDRNTCGSSSGSAAAAAPSLCAAAVGTETNGSIVCPASINGVVGIKPTVGLVSQSGIIPISHTQDTAGPIARTVLDAALLLDALAERETNFAGSCRPGGLRGSRIGVYRPIVDRRTDVAALTKDALDALRGEGAELIDLAGGLPDGEEVSNAGSQVLQYEFKAGLNRYFSSLPASVAVRTLADLIAFNEANADRELVHFGQERLLRAQAKGSLDEPEYLAALALTKRMNQAEGIDKIIDEHQLDAILAPTNGPAWLTDLANGDSGSGISCASYAARAGYPHITVPMGYIDGLPVGLSLFGKALTDSRLIQLAYNFEQATKARRPPTYLATVGGLSVTKPGRV